MLGTENQHKPDVFVIVWRFNVGGLNILKAWFCSVMIYDGYSTVRTLEIELGRAKNGCLGLWTNVCSVCQERLLKSLDLLTATRRAWPCHELLSLIQLDSTRLPSITSTYLCSSHRIHANSSTLCALRQASLMCLATSAVVLKWYRQYHHWNQNNNHSSGLASKTEATGRSLAQIKVFHQRFATSFVPLKKIDASVTGLAPPQLLEDPSVPSGLYHI